MRPFFIGARCSRVTGELTGHFLALDARIGEVLYRSELPLIGGGSRTRSMESNTWPSHRGQQRDSERRRQLHQQ